MKVDVDTFAGKQPVPRPARRSSPRDLVEKTGFPSEDSPATEAILCVPLLSPLWTLGMDLTGAQEPVMAGGYLHAQSTVI